MNENRVSDLTYENHKNMEDYRYIRLSLEQFAEGVDNQIQNRLMRELMIKYSELSNSFEELVEEKVKEISESQMATIFALVKLAESRDDDTGKHIERTAKLCKLLARLLSKTPKYKDKIDTSFINNIYYASPLHDIGKVGIPDNILLKPGKLTKEEFEIMKTHTSIGYNTLLEVGNIYNQNSFIKQGMEISRSHHEKWDGSGYPEGLKGEEIPLSGRIMAMVDVYDALRSKRVYKEAFNHERSLQIIIEGRGKHFDPFLTDIFAENQDIIRETYELI